MKGRKPKPTAIKVLQGIPGKRPLPRNEPKPRIDASPPQPPEWLDVVGKQCWNRNIDAIWNLGIVTVADYESLSIYCDIYSRWWKARKYLNQKGSSYVMLDADGKVIAYRAYPQMQDYTKLVSLMAKYQIEYGWTPSSRARMGTGRTNEKPMDALDDFLSKQNWGSTEPGEA